MPSATGAGHYEIPYQKKSGRIPDILLNVVNMNKILTLALKLYDYHKITKIR